MKYIKGQFLNGQPFEALVEDADFSDFMTNAHNSISDGSLLDMESLIVRSEDGGIQ